MSWRSSGSMSVGRGARREAGPLRAGFLTGYDPPPRSGARREVPSALEALFPLSEHTGRRRAAPRRPGLT